MTRTTGQRFLGRDIAASTEVNRKRWEKSAAQDGRGEAWETFFVGGQTGVGQLRRRARMAASGTKESRSQSSENAFRGSQNADRTMSVRSLALLRPRAIIGCKYSRRGTGRGDVTRGNPAGTEWSVPTPRRISRETPNHQCVGKLVRSLQGGNGLVGATRMARRTVRDHRHLDR
jgi:hypothetical protein